MGVGAIVAREFLWLIVTLIISLPLGIAFLWFLGFTPETVNLKEEEADKVFWLYLTGYLVSFLFVYVMRFTAMAIRALTAPPAEPTEAAEE